MTVKAEKDILRLTRDEIAEIISRLWMVPRSELEAHLSDPKRPSGELLVGTILLRAITEGCHKRLDSLLDRVIGKVREEFGITTTDDRELEEISLDALSDLVRESDRLKADRLSH